MRNQPAVFLKLLVLLVPREMKMEHSGGVKAMTDEKSNQIRYGPMVIPAIRFSPLVLIQATSRVVLERECTSGHSARMVVSTRGQS
jgi:hypothetical protein